MNKLVENETEIINHIQGDANKLQDLPQIMIYLIGCVIEVIIGIFVGVWFFSWPFLVFITTTIVFGMFASFLYKIYLANMQDYYELKNNTQSLLRNIVKNLEFIKSMVWENYYYTRITLRRNKEIKILKYNSWVYLVWIFVIWICPIIGIICMLICQVYSSTDYLIVENMVIFLKIYFLIIEAMFAIPSCVEYLSDIKSSMNKIREFLSLSEIDVIIPVQKRRATRSKKDTKANKSNFPYERSNELMKNSTGLLSTNLVTKTNNSPQNDVMSTEKKNIKDTDNSYTSPENPILKKKNKWNEESYSKKQCGNVLTVDSQIKDPRISKSEPVKFKSLKLTNFELDINNGDLIMIYFSNKDPMRKNYIVEILDLIIEKVTNSKQISYLSTKPWLMTTTIKKNIIMNKPENLQKLDQVLKSSYLGQE